jgi:hypothetical protein
MIKTFIKFIVLNVIIAMFLSVFCVSGGVLAATATPISNKADFYNIRNNLSGNYYLTCDIAFEPSDFAYDGTYYNSGKCFLSIGDGKNPFKGTFDGRGFTVSGISVSISGSVYGMTVTPVNTGISTVEDDWTGDYIIDPTPKPTVSPTAGIFGSNQGTIKNLNVSNCTVKARSTNNATLYVGGIAAHNNGNILNCSVDNTLNCDAHSYIGGITGYQSGGIIKDCFVRGMIESDGVFGGIAGAVAGGSISNCYSSATFTGTGAAAIKMAGVDVLNNINNCYYISNSKCDGAGEWLSKNSAKNPSSYKDFDFANTWYMSGALRSPALKGIKLSEGYDIYTGDVDANGTVNLLDLVGLARYTANWNVSIHREVANINFNFTENGDDVVDLTDVAYLARHLAGWKDAVLY